jgi:tight adherence protein B
VGPLIVTFAVVLIGSFALLIGVLYAGPASKSTRQRIGAIRYSVHQQKVGDFEMKLQGRRGKTWPMNQFLRRFRVVMQLEDLLKHAGISMDVTEYTIVTLCAAAIPVVCVLLLGGMALAVIPALLAGSVAPYLWLRIQRSRRVKHFNEALPDAIDLLARALRAGHSVASAIEMVGEQSQDQLAAEFTQVFQQQRLGLPFREALVQMGERMPSRDLRFLITAILVQKETGGDLTEILDRAAHVIRERVQIEGEVRTRTAQGRLTGWVLSLLPVVMLILINLVNPGYSDILLHDPVGRYWLYAGAGLIAVGTLIIRKIVDVRV